MWGLIPAAGRGTHLQRLARSFDSGTERPRAVAEFLVERLIAGGATKLCFVINSGESQILEYFGGSFQGLPVCYVVQPRPAGLCDAIFRTLPLIFLDEPVAIGLPDTIWFPERALATLPNDDLSLLLFSVRRPELFDVVLTDARGNVRRIDVQPEAPQSSWICGAFKMPGGIMTELYHLWCDRDRRDTSFCSLVNAYLASGGLARAFPIGTDYVDVGKLDGWRQATLLLQERGEFPVLA